jgi:probable HAF family extracellular repeat protein
MRRIAREWGPAGVLLAGLYVAIREPKSRRILIGLCALLLALFALHPRSQSPTRHAFAFGSVAAAYDLVDLGALPGDYYTVPTGISDDGTVCGISIGPNCRRRAVVWSGGKLRSLFPENVIALATGISPSGDVVGVRVRGSAWRAFLYSRGEDKDLGTLGGRFSIAEAVNADRTVVGLSINGDRMLNAFIWSGGKMRRPEGLDSDDFSLASGVNGAGTTVGGVWKEDEGFRAFRSRRGGIDLVPALFPGGMNLATDIDDSGSVIGWSDVDKDGRFAHAFLWDGNRARDLGTLGGEDSYAEAINSRGLIVGESQTDLQEFHAVIWAAGRTVDLNTLVPHGAPWRLFTANGIDSRGRIVGFGASGGHYHGYLLSPHSGRAETAVAAAPLPSAWDDPWNQPDNPNPAAHVWRSSSMDVSLTSDYLYFALNDRALNHGNHVWLCPPHGVLTGRKSGRCLVYCLQDDPWLDDTIPFDPIFLGMDGPFHFRICDVVAHEGEFRPDHSKFAPYTARPTTWQANAERLGGGALWEPGGPAFPEYEPRNGFAILHAAPAGSKRGP